MVIVLGIRLKVQCPAPVLDVTDTSETADVHQVRSDTSYLRILENLTVKYSSVFVSDGQGYITMEIT